MSDILEPYVLSGNKNLDALMNQWAEEEITDTELFSLLLTALGELKQYLKEQEED